VSYTAVKETNHTEERCGLVVAVAQLGRNLAGRYRQLGRVDTNRWMSALRRYGEVCAVAANDAMAYKRTSSHSSWLSLADSKRGT
jgi:hypothetical protein